MIIIISGVFHHEPDMGSYDGYNRGFYFILFILVDVLLFIVLEDNKDKPSLFISSS